MIFFMAASVSFVETGDSFIMVRRLDFMIPKEDRQVAQDLTLSTFSQKEGRWGDKWTWEREMSGYTGG